MTRLSIYVVLSYLTFCFQASGQSGIITTVAGCSAHGYSGDGGPATAAELNFPSGVAVDASGNVFIADTGNNRIRRVSASGVITTVAGNDLYGPPFSFYGDGGFAVSAQLGGPAGVAVDASGNLFIADTGNGRIRKVSASGIITTVAGNGNRGFSGDGELATYATLNVPTGVAVDASGNLFIADCDNSRIRKVSTSGIITTVAGDGDAGFFGDGGPATSAELYCPNGVTVDSAGNLFFEDNDRIRKVSPSGIITTVAGNGTAGFSGDGGLATSASLYADGVVVDGSGNLFITDNGNNRIRKVSANGIITTVAGNGTEGFSGDGGPATSAGFYDPSSAAVDVSGNLFITDLVNNRIREVFAIASPASLTVSPSDITLSLVAGGSLSHQISLASPVAGLGWSASSSASWITLTPTFGTAPGTTTITINTASLQPGTYSASITISNPAASQTQATVTVSLSVITGTASLSVAPAELNFQMVQGAPSQSQSLQIGGTAGVAWQATASTSTDVAWLSVSPGAGQIPATPTAFVNYDDLLPGTYQGSITVQAPGAKPSTISVTLAIGQNGVITTFAGNGNRAFAGDGGQATSASLSNPYGIAVDASGNLFIAEYDDGRIRQASAFGTITSVAGGGTGGLGDGGPATSASLVYPEGVAVDASGNIFIADYGHYRVRKVSASGVITTVAGNGEYGFSGDGGPATAAELFGPGGVAVDAAGNVFIADTYNNRIRKVSPSGIISTFAGNGIHGFSGDGGPATAAELYSPEGLAVDASGNLFIADDGNNRIRKVSATGIITTVAGIGPSCALFLCGGFSGDGGPATAADLYGPVTVAVDVSGNLFIADSGNNSIRKVSATGIITTLAGNGTAGFSGDGASAFAAELNGPTSVAVDVSGRVFIADNGNERIREVAVPAPPPPPPSITPGGIVPVDSIVPTIQSGEWVSIFGANLASATVTWNGDFPMSLGGTSVTIGGRPAYLSFVSPTQINVQAPDDTATGAVPVVVTTPGGTATSTVTLAQFGPSFLLLDSKHVAGLILRSNGSGAYGGGTYDIIGPTGNSLGYPTVAAKAGDSVVLFAVGLGPTSPAVAPGQVFSGAAPTTNPVSLLINKFSATPTFAGLSGAGLYQLNLTVPAGLGTGDVSLVAAVGGVQTPGGVVISMQ